MSDDAASIARKDARIAELEAALAARDTLIETLRFQLAQLKRATFGQSSEKLSRQIEQLGYSTIFLPDHLDEGQGPIAVMAACAAVTTEVNVGVLVLDCDFRHPAFLAKELATIDHIAEGRLEVGIGAGWKTTSRV